MAGGGEQARSEKVDGSDSQGSRAGCRGAFARTYRRALRDVFPDGVRLPFEQVYMERRRRWGRLAMAVLMGDAAIREKFTPAFIEKTRDILGEVSWAFPAHAGAEPTGKDPYAIDLFAAECANMMAEMVTIFGDLIPADLREAIRARLREQIFENYLYPRSELTWKRAGMNWNAVCHQGVLGAALALEEDNNILAAMIASTAESMRIFLGGFGADGSTSEGPGYWAYGFGRFAELNRQLETGTGGAFSFFGKNQQIRRIAQFAPGMALSNGHLVNFSDGHRKGRLPPALLAYLGARLDLPYLRQEAAATYRHEFATGIDLNMPRCDVHHMTHLFLWCPTNVEIFDEPIRADRYFPDYGAVVLHGADDRGRVMEFAAKGGNNQEHHNHNDCGSFILNVNGEPALIEIGAPEYVGPYFKSDESRYTFLAARSLGHSVPLVNGVEQPPGAQYAAKVLACDRESNRVTFKVDLTNCYPASAGCRKLIRTFVFEKGKGRIRVSDEFELEGPGTIESMLITDSPVRPDGAGVRIEAKGGALRVTPQAGASYAGVESCPYRNHAGRDAAANRLTFRSSDRQEGVITCEISVL